ncbi:N-alpha-acetyltransferase 40 isoform 3-T3 [Liasis olivaceus]
MANKLRELSLCHVSPPFSPLEHLDPTFQAWQESVASCGRSLNRWGKAKYCTVLFVCCVLAFQPSWLQRKSSKGKEKKQKRLEERAAMDAVCAKVEAANKLGDPLEAFPVFKKYDRNGLNVSIECKRVSSLDPATLDWAFELTKTNMQTLYEQSEWGWKDREKREEMTDDRAWYLIALEDGSLPVAFSHFRFDVEYGEEVLYCTQMKKVMLTVFKHNHGANQFFRDALQFEIDDTSPSVSGCCGEDCSYEILSRRTKFGESQQAHLGTQCGGCCH